MLLDLEVGDRRPRARIPVDHVAVAVDVALLVQRDEHLEHGLRVRLVEREPLLCVVARRAEPLELLNDRPAVLLPPLPDALLEALAPELDAAAALQLDLALDLHLGRDPGVISAEDPLAALAAHPVVAGQRVHDRVLERVPHVQHAGDVRRRNRDRVVLGRRPLGRRVKDPGLEPLFDDRRLDVGGVVAGRLLEVCHRALSLGQRECTAKAHAQVGEALGAVTNVCPSRGRANGGRSGAAAPRLLGFVGATDPATRTSASAGHAPRAGPKPRLRPRPRRTQRPSPASATCSSRSSRASRRTSARPGARAARTELPAGPLR